MPSTPLGTYRKRRNFANTAEPPGGERADATASEAHQNIARFVVQKHAAHRAGTHYDFRLEHRGVLLSWAVPKGPSLDPADKRMAIHVEDHPIEYADFEGSIPEGSYGAGKVEPWDSGTWQPLIDPDRGLREGELKFVLHGARLRGRFVLVRMRNRRTAKSEPWLLIKERDETERQGANAAKLESEAGRAAPHDRQPPASSAQRRAVPSGQKPQLCAVADEAPEGAGWISEIKLDGYRIMARLAAGHVQLLTRGGLDWAERLPTIARAIGGLHVGSAVLDGELVVLDSEGVSSFTALQTALSDGRDEILRYFVFDLLEIDGWDLRSCALVDRKRVLAGMKTWSGPLHYCEHVEDSADEVLRHAFRMHLEGIVCKRTHSPYRAGRGPSWVKVKCIRRDEFVIIGWTPAAGSRQGFGALHLGVFEAAGCLAYVGGVGTGFSERILLSLRKRLDNLKAARPATLRAAGAVLDKAIRWVRPELVAEIRYVGWSGGGRLRHAVFVGLREDKPATDVAMPARSPETANLPASGSRRAVASRIVTARAPRRKSDSVGGVELTNPDKELWTGVTKRDLASYWQAVAAVALPGIARRPLSILRCPDGIPGEHFFQKHGHHLPSALREGSVSGQPYIAVDDESGLIACAQMAAIELHVWGAAEDDALRPDRMVFDLDPGEGVGVDALVAAAGEVRERLAALGLAAFCRTSGGKGLHVVSPLDRNAGWDEVRQFCHAFAQAMADDSPERFVAHVKIADRRGKILIDWLRNGLGATAVASFSPRARDGATVATPLAWNEVNEKLDPNAFTIESVPLRLGQKNDDPWGGFDYAAQRLPSFAPGTPAKRSDGVRIVTARKPSRRR